MNPLFFASAWADSDTFLWIGGTTGVWEDGANWKNLDSMTVGLLPLPVDDVMIDGDVIVTVTEDLIIESVQLSGGAKLVIAPGVTMSTTEGGLDGSNSIRLDYVSENGNYPNFDGTNMGPSELVVEGTLYLDNDDANGSGLYITAGTTVRVKSTGSISITNEGLGDRAEAIVVRGDGASLINEGTITVVNAGTAGIRTTGADIKEYNVVNNGTLTISGGDVGLDVGSVYVQNNGTLIVSDAPTKIITLGGRFRNFGTLGGNGTVGVHPTRLILEPNSTISPGTTIPGTPSAGTLTFDSDINLPSGVKVLIEIIASNSYDRIIVQGTAGVVSATLNLDGPYTPVSGNNFLIVDSTTGQVDGSFGGGPFSLNGVPMVFDNTSDGVLKFGSVLPVTLTSFTARPIGKAVQLDWATATETNNDYFSIEHSTDGRTFSEIGRLTGAGTTQEEQRYAFVHRSPEAGLNYYRLDQHDFDGAHEYSPVQTAVIEGKNTWTAWPTLARDVVNLEWVEAPKGSTVVEVFNTAGQKVYSQPAPRGAVRVQVPVQQWAPGMYWVVVQGRGGADAQWFMKE